MKTTYLMALAAAALTACGNKASDVADTAATAKPPKEMVARLSGTLSVLEVATLAGKSGKVAERKVVLQGTVDQLVNVHGDSSGAMTFTPVNGGPLTMNGRVSENAHYATDTPDDSMTVKARGNNAHAGKLGEFSLTIQPSILGGGDEVAMSFVVPMSGKLTFDVTNREGHVTDLGFAGGENFLSGLEADPGKPGKRLYKHSFTLMPALGATPSEASAKLFYDGIKASPGTAHLGLVTAPGRHGWSYTGSTYYGKPGVDIRWDQKVDFKLNLTKP